jgi:hypothetical protein
LIPPVVAAENPSNNIVVEQGILNTEKEVEFEGLTNYGIEQLGSLSEKILSNLYWGWNMGLSHV